MKRLMYTFVFVLSLENALTCPSSCSCLTHSQGSNVNCNNRGLTKIPTDIPDDVYQLNLNDNKIKEIDEHSFSNMSKVYHINLDRNLISTIPAGAFKDLHNLETIYIRKNGISVVERHAFTNLLGLRYLYLDKNNISIIQESVFINLPGSLTLYLKYNEMHVIQEDAFVDLQVRYMYMRYNKITSIHPGAFRDSNRLYILYLDYNNISAIKEGAFANLTSLNKLHLDHNNIVTLASSTFVNLQSLTYLYLEYNKLKTTGSGMFKNLPLLYYLNLQYNEITTIEEDSFGNLPNLEYLYLDYNNVTVVKKGAFATLTDLDYLSFKMRCDCTNIEFWKWIRSIPKYATSVICYDRDNMYLASLQACSFNKCSVDPCYSNPCSNNGVCAVSGDGRAFCTCHGLWTGQHCEVSPCSTWNCDKGQCYYNESGLSTCVDPLHQQCPVDENSVNIHGKIQKDYEKKTVDFTVTKERNYTLLESIIERKLHQDLNQEKAMVFGKLQVLQHDVLYVNQQFSKLNNISGTHDYRVPVLQNKLAQHDSKIRALESDTQSVQTILSAQKQDFYAFKNTVIGIKVDVHNPVACKAIIDEPVVNARDAILFNHVEMNEGNAFNARTGIFTCPQRGWFRLSLS